MAKLSKFFERAVLQQINFNEDNIYHRYQSGTDSTI